MKKNAR